MDLKIKGKYYITITYTRMFNQYKTTYTGTNLITEKGLEFLVGKWNSDSGQITKMILGTNEKPPTSTDIINTFTDQFIFNVDVHTEQNKLIMSSNNISGKHLNDTTEIGVIATYNTEYSKLDETTDFLVSRSIHPVINIPETSIISFEYEYILTA